MRKILFQFILIIFVSGPAHGTDVLIEIENLWLTQDIHVSAEYLCQDGVYVYFNSSLDCFLATNKMSCGEGKLKVSPLNYIEKVTLPNGDFVTQFFSIQNIYSYMVYELVEDEPIKNYSLVQSKQEEIPVCLGMNLKKPEKVRGTRPASKEERSIFRGLLDSGVSIVNSPWGKISPEMLVARSGDGIDQAPVDSDAVAFKSPLCSDNLNYKDLVVTANGEWSGNGIIAVNLLHHWQDESKDLKVRKAVNKKKTTYEFFCIKEPEDV